MSFFGITDIGKKRKNNQDCFKTASFGHPECSFEVAVLCDGMGGAAGGAVASKLAADSFMEYIGDIQNTDGSHDEIRRVLLEAGQKAHMSVYNCAAEYVELDGMGTTLVSCVYYGRALHIINAGDSRLYTIKDKSLTQRTKDHSLVQELLDKNKITTEEAKNHPYRNYIMRALGTEETLVYDYFLVEDGFDFILMCSDGLYNFVSEEDICECVCSEAAVDKKLETLIAAANNGGGGDNITAVLFENSNLKITPTESE